MDNLNFNGKRINKGKSHSRPEPKETLYTLTGSKPLVHVEETTWRGKTTFYVNTRIGAVTMKKAKSTGVRRRRYHGFQGGGFRASAPTLPVALARLEKEMADTFKRLADVLGYELQR